MIFKYYPIIRYISDYNINSYIISIIIKIV